MLVAQLGGFSPRKAVKATLVLLPLLGITYMLFFVNPGEDEISRIVFIYFNSFLESFQVRSSALAPIPGPHQGLWRSTRRDLCLTLLHQKHQPPQTSGLLQSHSALG